MIFSIVHFLIILLSSQTVNPVITTIPSIPFTHGLGSFADWIFVSDVDRVTECCPLPLLGTEACTCFSQVDLLTISNNNVRSEHVSGRRFNPYALSSLGPILPILLGFLFYRRSSRLSSGATGHSSTRSTKKRVKWSQPLAFYSCTPIFENADSTQPSLSVRAEPDLAAFTEPCSAPPKDVHVYSQFKATCVAAATSLQPATFKYEAVKETQSNNDRLSAVKADIDRTRPLIDELGRMWDERIIFQNEIARLQIGLFESRNATKRLEEVESLNSRIMNENVAMAQELQRQQKTESVLRHKLSRQEAKMKVVHVTLEAYEQATADTSTRLAQVETKLQEREIELKALRAEMAEQEAARNTREAKTEMARKVLEEWERSLLQHAEECKSHSLRSNNHSHESLILSNLSASSKTSSSDFDTHVECDRKLQQSEAKYEVLRQELVEWQAAQEVQRKITREAQTILNEWEYSLINNLEYQRRRSKVCSHSVEFSAKLQGSDFTSPSHCTSLFDTPNNRRSVFVSPSNYISPSDTPDNRILSERSRDPTTPRARSASPGQPMAKPQIFPSESFDLEANQHSRDKSLLRLADGLVQRRKEGASEREFTKSVGGIDFESKPSVRHESSSSSNPSRDAWHPITKSTFPSHRVKRQVPLTESDSDVSMIIKSNTNARYEDDIFIEGQSNRKIEMMVKKRLRRKNKRVGNMPVCSDPEDFCISDLTFIGKPSSLTPDLTVSRTLYGLPDNSSTPVSIQRSKSKR